MKELIASSIFVSLAVIIMPAMSIDFGVDDNKITHLDSGNSSNGCWIYFETNNLNGFSGSYMHYHVKNSSSYANFQQNLQAALLGGSFLSAAFALEIGEILLALDGANYLVEKAVKNKDGSYDFYILKAKNESQYYFVGFISKEKNIPLGLKLPYGMANPTTIDSPNIIRSMEPTGREACV